MIKNFKSKDAEILFQRKISKRIPQNIQKIALRKLLMIHAATTLSDLLVPPGNRLEALKGSMKGKYSIRINDQWRIRFEWNKSDAYDVEIIDYH